MKELDFLRKFNIAGSCNLRFDFKKVHKNIPWARNNYENFLRINIIYGKFKTLFSNKKSGYQILMSSRIYYCIVFISPLKSRSSQVSHTWMYASRAHASTSSLSASPRSWTSKSTHNCWNSSANDCCTDNNNHRPDRLLASALGSPARQARDRRHARGTRLAWATRIDAWCPRDPDSSCRWRWESWGTSDTARRGPTSHAAGRILLPSGWLLWVPHTRCTRKWGWKRLRLMPP